MFSRPAPLVPLLIFSLLVLPVQADMPRLVNNSLETNWEGQSIIAVLATFLAVVILGFILIARREQRKQTHRPLQFWLGIIAGLFYLGGSAVVLVHLFRELSSTGISLLVPWSLLYALVPAALGIWAMRLARSPDPGSLWERIPMAAIGLLGLLFWSGFVIGPIIALCAAVIPAGWSVPSLPHLPGK